MESVKDPLCFMLQQVRWREVGYWPADKLGLAKHRGPELPGPGIDILENVFVNCLQVGSVEVSSGGLHPQFVHSGAAVQRLEGREVFRVPDARNISKNVRSRIEIRV